MQGALKAGEVPKKYTVHCYLNWEDICLRHDGLISSRLSFSVKTIQTLWGIVCVVHVQH